MKTKIFAFSMLAIIAAFVFISVPVIGGCLAFMPLVAMPKRAFTIVSTSFTTGSDTPVTKTISSGIINGILIYANAAFHASDTITITYRDAKGARPITNNASVLNWGLITDLRLNTALPTRCIYVPVGCLALGNDAELDVRLFLNTNSVNKSTVTITGVLMAEEPYHILQHITVTGTEIANKEICDLYVLNASSHLTDTIEIGFRTGRSEFISISEAFAISEVFGNGTASSAAVIHIYSNRRRLNEVEFVRTNEASLDMMYSVATYVEEKLHLPYQQALAAQQLITAGNPGAPVAKKAQAVENAFVKNIAAPKQILSTL